MFLQRTLRRFIDKQRLIQNPIKHNDHFNTYNNTCNENDGFLKNRGGTTQLSKIDSHRFSKFIDFVNSPKIFLNLHNFDFGIKFEFFSKTKKTGKKSQIFEK